MGVCVCTVLSLLISTFQVVPHALLIARCCVRHTSFLQGVVFAVLFGVMGCACDRCV